MTNQQLMLFSMVKIWNLFLQDQEKDGCSLLPLLFNKELEFLAIAIQQEKEVVGNQIGKKEVKQSLFAADMVLYIENPKDRTLQNLLEMINKFSKARGYIKIQKSLAFLFTYSELSERHIDITFSFFSFIFNWRIIALQNCAGFCDASTWINHPLGCHTVPGLSSLCPTANSHWLSVLHMEMYMFQCYSLNSSHSLLSPLCPQVCSLYLHHH